jgi:hypothetical protein
VLAVARRIVIKRVEYLVIVPLKKSECLKAIGKERMSRGSLV